MVYVALSILSCGQGFQRMRCILEWICVPIKYGVEDLY